jgi:hypothetical protein
MNISMACYVAISCSGCYHDLALLSVYTTAISTFSSLCMVTVFVHTCDLACVRGCLQLSDCPLQILGVVNKCRLRHLHGP